MILSIVLLVIPAILNLTTALPMTRVATESDVDGRRGAKISFKVPLSAIQDMHQKVQQQLQQPLYLNQIQGQVPLQGRFPRQGQMPLQGQFPLQGQQPLSDAELQQLVGRLHLG